MPVAVKAMLTVSPLLIAIVSGVGVLPAPAAIVAVLVIGPDLVAVTTSAVGVVAGLPHVSSRLAVATQSCLPFAAGLLAVQERAVAGSVSAGQVTLTAVSLLVTALRTKFFAVPAVTVVVAVPVTGPVVGARVSLPAA